MNSPQQKLIKAEDKRYNMEKIKSFISTFLKSEVEASDASITPNLDDYNQKLNFMNSFCVKELSNEFGMIPQNKLESDEFYERWKNTGKFI